MTTFSENEISKQRNKSFKGQVLKEANLQFVQEKYLESKLSFDQIKDNEISRDGEMEKKLRRMRQAETENKK